MLPLFEAAHPADPRPREAVDAARAFAAGGRRTAVLRRCAWAALRAAREAGSPAAAEAARAAGLAAAAAYLHPLASAAQVRHVLGPAASAVRAAELAGDVPAGTLEGAVRAAPPAVAAVLRRLPAAPPGGGRGGELVRRLDAALRAEPG